MPWVSRIKSNQITIKDLYVRSIYWLLSYIDRGHDIPSKLRSPISAWIVLHMYGSWEVSIVGGGRKKACVCSLVVLACNAILSTHPCHGSATTDILRKASLTRVGTSSYLWINLRTLPGVATGGRILRIQASPRLTSSRRALGKLTQRRLRLHQNPRQHHRDRQ